jgi:hypothetical protein
MRYRFSRSIRPRLSVAAVAIAIAAVACSSASPSPADAGGHAENDSGKSHDSGKPLDSGKHADSGEDLDSGKHADSGKHLDSGADVAANLEAGVTVTSCNACSADQVCVIGGQEGGACVLTDAGQMVPDGGTCPNGATGFCCNTFATYTCYPRPASCGSSVTCGCADGLCGTGPGGCHDDGTGGSVFSCIEQLA